MPDKKPPPAEIRRAYDRWSDSYDTMENRTRDLDEALLRRLLPPPAGQTVVEVGCGTGKNSVWLTSHCARLLGLDFSGRMLARARRKLAPLGPAVALVQCDVTRAWPLRAGLADLVLINLVLEHVPALAPVLAQAARALRPGGTLFVSEYHPARIAAGQGARFEAEEGTAWVGSYAHWPAGYEAAAATSGLALQEIAAWDDGGAQRPVSPGAGPLPRLLTLTLVKR